MSVRAEFWQAESEGRVRCALCPHRCLIKDGSNGKCLIRKNIGGILFQSAYGQISSAAIDPMEKKPLYHFLPSSNILSVGTNGCNMSCLFCQNWNISTKEVLKQETTPEALLRIAEGNSCSGIAYTYNEPLIWYEFVRDCAEVFNKAGLKNVIVSNGMINPEPLKALMPLIDAANIDLKGFTDEFYKEHGGHLGTVKNTITELFKAGVHLEITNLVIPEKNDNENTFDEMCIFISSLSRQIPLHISRYFPQHKYTLNPTPNNTLTALHKRAKKYLDYVYIGNSDIIGTSDTLCHNCGHMIISRKGYNTKIYTDEAKCPQCSEKLPLYL